MADPHTTSRSEAFRRDTLLWIVVRHFLSAELLRELSDAIIAYGTDGRLALPDLFEEVQPSTPTTTGNWFVRPRPIGGNLEGHLRRLVTDFIWQADNTYPPDREGLSQLEAKRVAALAVATDLATSDLGNAPFNLADCGEVAPLLGLVEALNFLADRRTAITAIDAAAAAAALVGLNDTMLRALLTKHLGDLCSDIEAWEAAGALYDASATLLAEAGAPEWFELRQAALAFVKQSSAMITWHAQGPASAAEILDALLAGRELGVDPLPVVNGTFDRMTARLNTGDLSGFSPDQRVAVVLAPQILHTHHLESALVASQSDRFHDLVRRFWAVLRRQIALGGTTQAMNTKGQFGRAVIADLEGTMDRHDRANHFSFGIAMLVASGDRKHVERAAWSGRVIGAYLRGETIEQVEALVEASPGMGTVRRMVASALYREWLLRIPTESKDLAAAMLTQLANAARNGDHGGIGNFATGTHALKGLREIGAARPEFRGLAHELALATLEDVLGRWGMVPASEALEMAVNFIDGVGPVAARAIAGRVIQLVQELRGEAAWPITQAATRLLSSAAVEALARTDEAFRSRRDPALVRLALNSPGEHLQLLWLLRSVEPSTVEIQVDALSLKRIVEGVRRKAEDIRSSGAASNAHALLGASRVVGREGVETALDSLQRIILSVAEERPSPAFHNGYEPLLLLARERDKIAQEAGVSEKELRRRCAELVNALASMWTIAAQQPLVFASFALPPNTEPDRTMVHNWTFASLEFASAVGAVKQIGDSLAIAMASPKLAGPIATGRAARHDPVDEELFNHERIAADPPDAFYAALGQRLLLLDTKEDPVPAIAALLRRCLAVGPRGEDAALLLAARRLHVHLDSDNQALAGYQAKLLRDRSLRLSLSPLLSEVTRRTR